MIASVAVLIAAAIVVVLVLPPQGGGARPTTAPTPGRTTTPTPSSSPSPSPTPTPTPTPTFDSAAQSIDDPASYWVVVDKLRPLNPADYYPADLVDPPLPYTVYPLRQAASDAAVQMFAAFTAESGGLEMQFNSAFRSFESQGEKYAYWTSVYGQEGADLTSARPGHSEHQTGLAIDVAAAPEYCTLEQCFADTPQGQWLAANSWRFGFIVRYPNGMTAVTGYEYEPWHMRYVGVELATEMHNTGVATLEEFFGLPAAPTYAG